ncbi:hypothetical protein HY041_03095 [Candidatus Roizmanbacteria bacterium]|nr:hypothetical protein [Candidatus Roizmanbacteria bacterium]
MRLIIYFVLFSFLVMASLLIMPYAVYAQYATPTFTPTPTPPGPTATPTSTPTPTLTPTPTPLPTPYPTVAISGLLKEYNGVSCTNDISSNTLAIYINPDSPAGVTPVCGITPPSGSTKSSYRCTVVFDNLGANPTPAQNLNLSASATEYSSANWTDNNVCGGPANNALPVNVAAPAPTTVFDKDIFFKSSGNWLKLKDLSFSGNASLTNIIPNLVSAYDSDDNSSRYFITSGASTNAGVSSANSINLGTANASENNWKMTGYTRQVGFTPSIFMDYVKSRKSYTTVSDPANFDFSAITEPGIYYANTHVTITNDPGTDVVLIVNGNATINQNFNRNGGTDKPKKAVAILANNIYIDSSVQYAYGIFAASSTFFTGASSNGLKVKGNVSANTLDNQRTQSDSSKPAFFALADADSFLTLLSYLSISKYDQTIQ